MKKIFFLLLVCGLWSVASSPSALAGGPLSVNDVGVAAVWDTSDSNPIAVNPESGACATFSNAEMIDKIDENISHWSDIAGIDLSFDIAEGDLGSVGADNYTDFIVISDGDPGQADGLNPIVFDDTGEIVDDIFGSCNRFVVLGFAGPDNLNADADTITDGDGVFNCLCLDGNPNGPCDVTAGCAGAIGFGAGDEIVFTEADLNFTMTHEVGHMLNLDHTQVNAALADAGCDTSVDGDCDDLPTMYPISEDAADQITPSRDDEVALLTLYGGSALSGDCTVTGSLTDSSGNPLRCADVQATTGDTADTIAQVSGAFASTVDDNPADGYTDGDGECLSDCGDFTLRGLDPAKTYTITVKPIDSSFVDGSSVGPCGDGQLTGINEEVIATGVNCGAGETDALGTVETTSTGGVVEGGGDGDGDGSSASAGCNLTSSHEGGLPLATMIALMFAVPASWRVLLRRS